MDQYLIHQQILLVLSSKFIRIWLLLTTGSALTFVTSACLDSHSNLLLKRWLPSMSLLINLLQKRAFWNTKSCLSSEIHFSFFSLLYSWDLLCLAHREYTKKRLVQWKEHKRIYIYICVYIYIYIFQRIYWLSTFVEDTLVSVRMLEWRRIRFLT